jgi:hypothetical protein
MKAFRQLEYPTSPEHVASPQVQDASERLGRALWVE